MLGVPVPRGAFFNGKPRRARVAAAARLWTGARLARRSDAQACGRTRRAVRAAREEAAQHPARHHARRLRRPSAMLSFVYALLRHDVESAVESVGLEPAVGFLHTDRPGRLSLALNLMEELHAHLADRLVLTLIRLRRRGQRRGRMDEATRKEVISAWQRRKQEAVFASFPAGERASRVVSLRTGSSAGSPPARRP